MSTAEFALAETVIAEASPSPLAQANGYFFDPFVTVISQYANSPILLAIVNDFAQWLDPAARFEEFFLLLWDIDTAVGYGLDNWGRILGVGRVLQVLTGQEYLGFEQDADAQSFGYGIFYSGAPLTGNFALTDAAYRTLLLAKAALNITDASIPAINTILLNLFGQGYVIDNLDMSMVYHFDDPLSPVETSIIYQSGVLPKPCGVSFTVEAP